ncbi:MAG: helix-turn-helix domain-containing protein [Roseiflexaceae bacterium]|nr:helix-turn-helix domain-containing protein [Roseiflexaceae bacterium]
MARPRVEIPYEELRELYVAGQSTLMLAQRYGCSPTTISAHLRRCGVQVRQARFREIDIPAAVLHDLYVLQRQSLAQIAQALGVSPSTIRNRCRSYGFPTRQRTYSDTV